jgi:hypothetical protein
LPTEQFFVKDTKIAPAKKGLNALGHPRRR